MVKRYGPADYQAQLQKLLPPGPAWNRRPDSNLGRLLLAEGDGLARIEAESFRLIAEANPLTTEAGLEDWESVVGLPDECSKLGATASERLAAVLWKLRRPAGQSKAFFIELLEWLGYEDVQIEDYQPFRADVSAAGDHVYHCPAGTMVDDQGLAWQDYYSGWAFVWGLLVPTRRVKRFRTGTSLCGQPLSTWTLLGPTISYFSADRNVAGDPLSLWSNPDIECRLNQLKPAHTLLLIYYLDQVVEE